MANFDKEEHGPFHFLPIPGGGAIEITPASITDVTRSKDGDWIIHTAIGVRYHEPPKKERQNG